MKIERVSKMLIAIDGYEWKRCKARLRGICSDCSSLYERKAIVYRPIRGSFRDERLCEACVETLLSQQNKKDL